MCTLMLSLDSTRHQISHAPPALELSPGCLSHPRVVRAEANKHVGARNNRRIELGTGTMAESRFNQSGNCSTCWPMNKTNC
jgi:hypothetical protein